MNAVNPFTPDFGRRPPVLAGRDDIIDRMKTVLAAGPSRREFTTLLLGPRGVGKTTVLAAIANDAQQAGWRTIRVNVPLTQDPDRGAVGIISEKIRDHLEDISPQPKRRLTGMSMPLLAAGATWEHVAAAQPTYQKLLDTLVGATVDIGGAGVLLAIDEFHNITPADASFVAGALQEIVKIDQKPLAFIAAGLPHIEHTLLTDEGFTFFHRCHRDRVEGINLQDAMDAIGRPLADNSFFISGPHLRRAAAATRGLGYAVQSLGHHLWEIAGPPPAEITDNQVDEAIALMEGDVDTHVVVPIWSRLSPADKRFLCTMVGDDGPSRIADVAARLGTAATSAPVYRQRLLKQGAIVEAGRGFIRFASEAIKDRAAQEKSLTEMTPEQPPTNPQSSAQ
ncbi:MAG: ATP-binding protein [bacterium]|nr:ATP-binding protein [bacterium]